MISHLFGNVQNYLCCSFCYPIIINLKCCSSLLTNLRWFWWVIRQWVNHQSWPDSLMTNLMRLYCPQSELILSSKESKSIRRKSNCKSGTQQVAYQCIIAGQENFRALTSAYYHSADAILIVYDITSSDSFDVCQFLS